MRNKNNFVLIVFALTFFFAANENTSAYSCVPERPVCEAFGTSSAVFVGKVVGAKQQNKEKNDDGTLTVYDVGEIYFQVEEAFLGIKQNSRVTIFSGTGGGDCGYWFKRGERYLIYGYGNKKEGFGTNICTRTRPVSDASEDLAFLRNLPPEGSGMRIYGTVVESIKEPNEDGWRQEKPMAGITVKVQGLGRTFEIVTDAEGKYELKGILAGEYNAYPILPAHLRVNDYSKEVFKVGDRGCINKNFWAENDSSISGRVISAEGEPLTSIWVKLIPKNKPLMLRDYGIDMDLTDSDGTFELKHIPQGEYLLGVNLADAPDDDAPYPPTFYPGVTKRIQAIVINVGAGQKISNLTLKLPPKLVERKVSGVVLWSDGRPATNIDVYLSPPEMPGRSINGGGKTDSQGRFTLRGYEGYTYFIQAYTEKLSENKKKEDVFAVPQQVDFYSNDITGVRLVLSRKGLPWEPK